MEEKIKILDLVKAGYSKISIAANFGVSRTTIYDIVNTYNGRPTAYARKQMAAAMVCVL
jgi:transposase